LGEKKQILIIDSDTQDIQRVSDHLRQYNFEIFVATDSKKGMELFVSEFPDIILVNLLMPGMTGTDIIMAVRGKSQGAKIPIVALSQLTAPSTNLVKDLGVQDVLQKPVDLIALDKALRSVFKDLKKPSTLALLGKSAKSKWQNVSFAKMPFIKILAHIYKNRATGILSLKTKKGKLKVKFVHGNPSAFAPSAFAKFLIRQGHLSSRQGKKLAFFAKKNKASNQEALAALNIFSTKDVILLFRAFVYDFSGEYSEIRDATSKFNEKAISGKGIISTLEIVWQGVRRTFDQVRVDRVFEKNDRRKRTIYLCRGMLPDVKIPDQLDAFLSRIGDQNRVSDIVNEFSDQNEIVVLQIIYSFLLCGLLTYNEREIHNRLPEKTEPEMDEKDKLQKKKKQKSSIDQNGVSKSPSIAAKRTKAKTELEKPHAFDYLPDDEPLDNDYSPDSAPDNLPDINEPEEPTDISPEENPDDSQDPKETGKVTASSTLSDRELLIAGDKFLESGSYSKAQACFEELIDRGVEKPEVYVNLGTVLYHNRFSNNRRKRLLNVAWAMKEALRLEVNYIPAYLAFAKILEKEGKKDIAREQYNAVLSFDSKNLKARAAIRRLKR